MPLSPLIFNVNQSNAFDCLVNITMLWPNCKNRVQYDLIALFLHLTNCPPSVVASIVSVDWADSMVIDSSSDLKLRRIANDRTHKN